MVGNDEFVNAELWKWINRLNVINRNEIYNKSVQYVVFEVKK